MMRIRNGWVLSMVIWVYCWSNNNINILVNGSHVVYEELQSVSATAVDNQYKTGFHFQPQKHWINDPNGPMYYSGIYHFFYQYNPRGAVWGNIVWAHSVSTDLINWVSVQPAIYPSKPFDIEGCWSGSATILPGNKPAILYTGRDPQFRQVQNVAFPKNLSDPYLREWVKPDYNPIIDPPEGVNVSAFRDPTTAWMGSDGHWRLVVGSRRKHRGMAFMYRSRDFIHWIQAKHPLHSANGTGMWECPDFFPVSTKKSGVDTSKYGGGLKYVFKVSLDLTRCEYYTIGSYRRNLDKYVPDIGSVDNGSGLRYDYGNFYASKTFYDAGKKRRILWGWSNESDSSQDDVEKGWAGIQTIPREVWLDTNGRQLIQWPVEELERLRGKEISVKDKQLKRGDLLEVSGILTSQADVEVSFQLSEMEKAEPFDPKWSDPQKLCEEKTAGEGGAGVGPFGLLALASANREEQTAVFFRVFKSPAKYVALMCHDSSRSSLRPELYKPTFGGFVDVEIKKNGKISLRSLIDHSVVESFGGGGRTCMTSRVYPSLAVGDGAHLFVFNNGEEDVRVSELKAWEIKKPLLMN